MDETGTTHVIAELSVGFIGFAGIVGALARGQLVPEHRHTWLGFWTMIEFGLALLFGSLLPSLLHHLGFTPWPAARISSAVLGAFLIGHLTLVTPLFMRARRGVKWPLGIQLLDGTTFLSLILAAVSQALNALGVPFTTSIGGFLLGLYLLLIVSGLNFALLAYLILLPEPDVPEDD